MKRLISIEDIDQETKKPRDNHVLVLHRKVGEGVYGKVYQARFEKDGKWRAVKILKNAGPKPNFMQDTPSVLRELLVGGTCSGIRRAGVIRFITTGEYGIVSDLGHCSLGDAAPKNIPLHAVRVIGKLLLQRIIEMHEFGAMHRDLKPDNVLLTWGPSELWPDVQLIDYGLSSPLQTSTDTNVVTLWWRAPEVLLGLKHSLSLDIWAFGVIMANLCCKQGLTRAINAEGVLHDVWEKLGYPSQEQWSCPRPPWTGRGPLGLGVQETHSSILGVLRAALQPNPDSRPTASELIQMPFWSEVPSIESRVEAQVWAISRASAFRVSPVEYPTHNFKRDQVNICCALDSNPVESDAQWMFYALSLLTEKHAIAAKKIANLTSWPTEALDLCLLIMDRTLNGSLFFTSSAETLACSAGFVTACLYADCEPSPSELKACCACSDSEAVIELGVHSVMKAMKYRLLPKDLCAKVKEKEKWALIKSWIK